MWAGLGLAAAGLDKEDCWPLENLDTGVETGLEVTLPRLTPDPPLVDIFLLLSEILGADTIESVRGELVITLHVRKHIKNNSTVNGCLHVISLSVCCRLKSSFSHFYQSPFDSTPFFEICHLFFNGFITFSLAKSICTIQQIRLWKILQG